jgi:hypothetical protein
MPGRLVINRTISSIVGLPASSLVFCRSWTVALPSSKIFQFCLCDFECTNFPAIRKPGWSSAGNRPALRQAAMASSTFAAARLDPPGDV